MEVLLGSDVGEYPVSSALPDVEGFAVSGIDEPVDIGLEFALYLW